VRIAFDELGVNLSAEEVAFAVYAGLYVRLIDSCITELKTHGPSRTCNESKYLYRGTSLIRNSAALGPYRRTMPRVIWWP
jgi:hypothetical protein